VGAIFTVHHQIYPRPIRSSFIQILTDDEKRVKESSFMC